MEVTYYHEIERGGRRPKYQKFDEITQKSTFTTKKWGRVLEKVNTFMYYWLYDWAIRRERKKRENHRKTSAIKLFSSHFRLVSHLRNIRFRQYLYDWTNFYLYKDVKTTT